MPPPNKIVPPLPRVALGDDDEGEKTREMPRGRVQVDRRAQVHVLRVVAGRDMLRFVTLDPGEKAIIGRDTTAQLMLSDASVSRRHATVQLVDGQVIVEDFASTNGTAVNGAIVGRSNLNVGDHLEVGGVSLRLDLVSQDEVSHIENVLRRLEAPRRDPLTGLLTRTYMDEDLPGLMQRSERANADLCCVFTDIDHFKMVNDRFGHQVGDDALVTVARLAMLSLRDSDACVRYGGEELLLILQGAGETGGFDVAERVRKAVYGHDWSRTSAGLRVSASFGVAQWQPGESQKDWIARADKALYVAKNTGRNRVVRASEVK